MNKLIFQFYFFLIRGTSFHSWTSSHLWKLQYAFATQ